MSRGSGVSSRNTSTASGSSVGSVLLTFNDLFIQLFPPVMFLKKRANGKAEQRFGRALLAIPLCRGIARLGCAKSHELPLVLRGLK